MGTICVKQVLASLLLPSVHRVVLRQVGICHHYEKKWNALLFKRCPSRISGVSLLTVYPCFEKQNTIKGFSNTQFSSVSLLIRIWNRFENTCPDPIKCKFVIKTIFILYGSSSYKKFTMRLRIQNAAFWQKNHLWYLLYFYNLKLEKGLMVFIEKI